MSYSVYQLHLPQSPEAVIFVNGFLARDRCGFLWMWKKILWIKKITASSEGCVQVKAGICSPNEFVMVSYWFSENNLKHFFRSEPHRQMMQFVSQNSHSLCLYNETYKPSNSGKYIHEPNGMAIIYERDLKSR